MKSYRVVIAAGFLLMCAALHSSAQELISLTSSELRSLCLAYEAAPESSESRLCAAYIRGFIDGSESIQRVEGESPQRESFSERAFRTRVGAQRASEPRYCLAATLPVSRFIGQLLLYLDESRATADARTAILGTLGRFYPCPR
jgi:hypothetical protein